MKINVMSVCVFVNWSVGRVSHHVEMIISPSFFVRDIGERLREKSERWITAMVR